MEAPSSPTFQSINIFSNKNNNTKLLSRYHRQDVLFRALYRTDADHQLTTPLTDITANAKGAFDYSQNSLTSSKQMSN